MSDRNDFLLDKIEAKLKMRISVGNANKLVRPLVIVSKTALSKTR